MPEAQRSWRFQEQQGKRSPTVTPVGSSTGTAWGERACRCSPTGCTAVLCPHHTLGVPLSCFFCQPATLISDFCLPAPTLPDPTTPASTQGSSREARNKVVDIFWNWGILVFGGTQEIIELSGRRCQVSFSKLCGLMVRDEANCCSATQAKNVLRFHSSSARVAYLHTAFRDPR